MPFLGHPMQPCEPVSPHIQDLRFFGGAGHSQFPILKPLFAEYLHQLLWGSGMPLAWGSEKPSGFGVAVGLVVVVSQPEEAIAEVAFVAVAAAAAAAAAEVALPAELG